MSARDDFKDYCLRALGSPVINIEITPMQIEDRVQEALDLYIEWHHDATEELWVSYVITQDDIDNKYIEIPENSNIIRVTEIRPVYEAMYSDRFFDPVYQIQKHHLSAWKPFDSIDYFLRMSNLQETLDLLAPTPTFEHVKHGNKLYVNQNIADLGVGYPFAMKVFKFLDPEVHNKVYKDKWLKSYTIALLKRQWASNIKKYEQVQLLGGIVLNGKELYDEAKEEIEKLEVQLEEKYQEPVGFIFG